MGVARHQQLRDEAGPARLMRGTDAAAGVAVEVLVEGDQIAPVRIVLEQVLVPEDRASALLVPQKDARQSPG